MCTYQLFWGLFACKKSRLPPYYTDWLFDCQGTVYLLAQLWFQPANIIQSPKEGTFVDTAAT